MKKLIYLSALLLLTQLAISQPGGRKGTGFLSADLRLQEHYNLHKGITIKGSPYLHDDFLKVTFNHTEELTLSEYIRYNIYTDQIEVKRSDSIMCLIPPDEMLEINLNENRIVHSNYIDNKEVAKGYFILANKGKYSLLIKKNIAFTKAEEAQAYQEAKPARFETKSDKWYIKYNNNPAKSFRNTKDIKKMHPELEALINDYSNTQKLKSNDYNSIVSLLDYINTSKK